MSQRAPACDEPFAEMRADARLRGLAKLDSVEPSRALDRAVLGLAREAAGGRAPRVGAGGRSLRWGLPAAVAAAAVCAVVVHRTASRPGAPRVADQRFVVERARPSQSNTLEMVSVSAHYRGAGSRVAAPVISAYLAPSGAGDSHGWLVPSFIQASVPLLSIRTAPLRKRAPEEQTPRAAMRSSERASRKERERNARRQIRLPELIYNVDLLEERPAPPPPPALDIPVGTSGRGAQVHDARAEAAPADPH